MPSNFELSIFFSDVSNSSALAVEREVVIDTEAIRGGFLLVVLVVVVLVVMGLGRESLLTHVVLGSQVLKALDSPEGVYLRVPRAGGHLLRTQSGGHGTRPPALLIFHEKWCLCTEQGLGCSDLVKNQGRR